MATVYEDYIGKRFGRLLITGIIYSFLEKRTDVYVECECDCDTEKKTKHSFYNVISGKTTSCGCYQKEMAYTANKKYNKYDLSGSFGIGYTNKGEEFYFDLEDYDKIKKYCWCKKSDEYIYAACGNGKPPINLHKLITDTLYSGIVVDHINRIKPDNRKENLRISDRTGNNRNSSLATNNKSGYIGVIWHDASMKWMAYITVNWKRKYLGVYLDINDAITARLRAEKEYFGEYAPQKHLFEECGV